MERSNKFNPLVKLYTFLMIAYPTTFRSRYGVEMVQLFRDDLARTRKRDGMIGVLGLWFMVLPDLFFTALAEHSREAFDTPLQKVRRWSGPAIAIGGPLFAATFTSYGFWGVIRDMGFPPDWPLHVIFAELGLILMMPGVVVLYRLLPAEPRPLREVTFGATLLGLAGLIIGTLGIDFPWLFPAGIDQFIFSIGILLFVGLTGTGLLVVHTQSLGKWRFMLLIMPASVVMLALYSLWVPFTVGQYNLITLAILILFNLGWLLIGAVLWSATGVSDDSALKI